MSRDLVVVPGGAGDDKGPLPPPLVYRGQVVITLQMIAEVHGIPIKTAESAWQTNRNRFKEERHFFKVAYKEWLELEPLESKVSSRGGRRGDRLLFTEWGYLLLATFLTDDFSVEVRERIIEGYFRSKALHTAEQLNEALQTKLLMNLVERMEGLEPLPGKLNALSSEMGIVKADVGQMRIDLGNVQNQITDIQDRIPQLRRDAGPQLRRDFAVFLLQAFNGKCPCCEERILVDKSGATTTLFSVDHFNCNRADNKKDNLWPVCHGEPGTCNQRLRNQSYRQAQRSHFESFVLRFKKWEETTLKIAQGHVGGQGDLFPEFKCTRAPDHVIAREQARSRKLGAR